jgi:hypothetical protein
MSGFALSPFLDASDLGGFTPPLATSDHMTIVALYGDWAWPNPGETQFLIFADSSWMIVGQSLEIDDGVQIPGILTIVAIYPANGEDPTIVECAWTAVGPVGGTIMLNGAAVLLVT